MKDVYSCEDEGFFWTGTVPSGGQSQKQKFNMFAKTIKFVFIFIWINSEHCDYLHTFK